MGPLAIAGIAGGVLGAIAGGQGSNQSSTTTRNLGPAGEAETRAGALSLQNLNELQAMLAQGPGAQDIQAGTDSQRSLATLLSQMQQTGGIPGQEDVNQANMFAGQVFQGQQNSLANAFNDQRVQASRAQARMGRGGFDPVLQNKLAQEQTRQQGQLAADQGSFAAQFAQSLPQQRLNYAQQHAGVMSGLASQAMANRQALFNMGQQLKTSDQNFRLGSASSTTSSSQPGGLMGALTGGIAGASSMFTGANNLMSMFGGSGGGTSNAVAALKKNPNAMGMA